MNEDVEQKKHFMIRYGFYIVIVLLLFFNLTISFANYVKPVQTVIFDSFINSLAQISAQNILLQQQVKQISEEYQKLSNEKK
jgi:hypothetical protein